MEIDKKELTITVRNKTFKISFVSNWVVAKYTQLNEKLQELQDLYSRLELLPPKEEITLIVKEIKEIGDNLLNEKLEIIEEVLTSNDIDFDRSWWEKRTDGADIALFLNQCAFKDVAIGKKKVKGK